MRLYELKDDGELTREIIREYGEPLNLKERIEGKVFGIGHLKMIEGNTPTFSFLDQNSIIQKIHLDWTKLGAIIRLRTSKKLYALGLTDEQIELIKLRKMPNELNAIPLKPFWLLLKLGVPVNIAKWFRLQGDVFNEGHIRIDLSLTENSKLVFEMKGDLWADCLSTFRIEKNLSKLIIEDFTNSI